MVCIEVHNLDQRIKDMQHCSISSHKSFHKLSKLIQFDAQSIEFSA